MIKAIETRYKGYNFRSRLEARYAVFFDALGLKWVYEKEGFDLGEYGLYLPDFWLPELKLWYEIKGELQWVEAAGGDAEKGNIYTYMDSPDLEKVLKFRDLCEEWPIACAEGQIGDERIRFHGWDLCDSSGGSFDCDDAQWCVSNGIVTLDLGITRRDRDIVSHNCSGGAMPQFTFARDFGVDYTLVEAAVEAARSARFEHGQSGAT